MPTEAVELKYFPCQQRPLLIVALFGYNWHKYCTLRGVKTEGGEKMKYGRWIKKWVVESNSGNGNYTVSLSELGVYGCSCPAWKFRKQECSHIQYIKSTKPNSNKGWAKTAHQPEPKEVIKITKPNLMPANVLRPIYKRRENTIYYPLVPIYPSDTHMEATICYFLSKYGFSWSEVQTQRHLPNSWTKRAVTAYIQEYGMKRYTKYLGE